MDRRLILYITISGVVLVGIMSGYYFAAILDDSPVVKISGFNYELSQVGTTYRVVFQGSVVNPGLRKIENVRVIIHWQEMGNTKHIDSINIGNVPAESSETFMISHECEYMLIVKSVSPTLEWS